MVGTGTASRWHKLRAKLLRIRHGPGAAILPSSVTRIHMEFAKTYNEGHFGPRRFWRDMLPRLKYHNPAIPMIVNRKDTNEGAAVMSLYFRKDSASADSAEPVVRVQPPSSAKDASKAADPAADERVVKIDMKGKRSEEILEAFLAETSATPLQPTPEEEAEMRVVSQMKRRGEVDREMQKKRVEEDKRERSMLAKAREAA